ncbi:MAG: DUF1501 domain-containing protein, partial [Prosthecobacter sp.]
MLAIAPSSRREMLRQSCAGFGMLALHGLLDSEASAASVNPLTAKQPHFPAKAKRVIFLLMKGGPSQVDTFDPKPLLDRDHGKPPPFALPRVTFAKTGNLLRSPWKFRQYGQSGLPVSDLFPHVGQCADELCVIRSMHGTNPAHGGALLKLHTGSDTFVRPSMGAWVSYGLGTENTDLPAFLTICPTLAHGGVNNWGSAFLPAWCQGTPLGNASVSAEQAVVRHIQNPRTPTPLQRMQLDLTSDLNHRHLEAAGINAALEARIESFELAFRMQSSMPEIQGIEGETEATKTLYGLNDPMTANFGRQCLMARRFAERGVRFIQVTHSDSFVQWDQHGDLLKGHTKNAAEVDKPIAGLLRDLRARGLLDDTLVLWGGEFGRTPVAQGTDGRDHNPHGFTMWMAG